MTTIKPATPLDLAQFEGHTPKLSTIAHELVTDAAYNRVSDLLLAQEVRDTSEATEEACDALLAECKRQRGEIARLRWALGRIVSASDQFVHDTGLKNGDLITDAADKARALLAKLGETA